MLLTIEKLIYGGDGLARLPSNAPESYNSEERRRGKAVFLPFVLNGERVEASLIDQKPGFARARADAILEPSPHRVAPDCPYFTKCGGCHYQHIAYAQQLEIKKQILRETLRRTAKLDLACEIEVHPSPPWNYRNRARLQVQSTPAFVAGYFRLASHELLPVEQCPISSPLINRGIAALWQSGREGKVPDGVLEVEFFANADDSRMLVELVCSAEARRAPVRSWAEDLLAGFSEITGITAFRQGKPGAASEKLVAVGADHLTYHTQSADYRVSAGSFFQTNRFLTDELVKLVAQGRSGQSALDLYAGVGLFSTALAGDFHHIVSVESSQISSGDLAYNRPPIGEVVQATSEQYLAALTKAARGGMGAVLPQRVPAPDLAVVDPPRSGLGESVARLLATLGARRVTYVSCDPATLARDLLPLLAGGYRLEQLHLVDLFPQTYHLEAVAQLLRE